MKQLFLLTLLITTLLSCRTEGSLREKFSDYMSVRHPLIKDGTQILFIVNKPECSPCIEAIKTTINAEYNAGKSLIVFGRQQDYCKGCVQLQDSEDNLARYGMLGVDGTICIFRDGRLRASVPFDTKRPEVAITAVRAAVAESRFNR
jgi:hypothetical protein